MTNNIKQTKEKSRYSKLSNEEREEKLYYREIDKQAKADAKVEKLRLKQLRFDVNRELNILKFMFKTDVLNHHHGKTDSTKKHIKESIHQVKARNNHLEYNSYIWNHQGEGNNYMPVSQFGCLFKSTEFETIYDVPLDGSYIFYTYDSGQRGLGSFDYISVSKVENEISVPTVNPGGFPPITC